MAITDTSRSSAQIERELDEQRTRIDARIGEIKERLSPGQLLDEALSYTKHGGAHFAANLGQQVSANPLPAALVGIGLAWLIASNTAGEKAARPAPLARAFDEEDYPYARISSGGLKRISHRADDAGQTLLRTAADDATSTLYSFRVTYPTGEIRYFQGRVFGFPETVDGADTVLMAAPTVEICTDIVKVAAE